MHPGSPEVSVVVPCYRTGESIRSSLTRIQAALEASKWGGVSWEIVVVADGDPEAYAFAREYASSQPHRIRVFGYSENRGKGFALRYGVKQSRGNVVTFIDADMQLPPEEISRMVALLELYEADIVVGSKRHPLSEVSYPWTRRVQSAVYQLVVALLFQVKVRDTQTGLKVLRREVAEKVIAHALVKRFAFDLEVLAIATHLGYRRIVEAPVRIEPAFSTTTNLKAVLHVLVDTLAIFYRLRITRYYDRDDGSGIADLIAQMPESLHEPETCG